jgi:hypothetical protein
VLKIATNKQKMMVLHSKAGFLLLASVCLLLVVVVVFSVAAEEQQQPEPEFEVDNDVEGDGGDPSFPDGFFRAESPILRISADSPKKGKPPPLAAAEDDDEEEDDTGENYKKKEINLLEI